MPKPKAPRKKYRPPAVPVTAGRMRSVRYAHRHEMWLKTIPHAALDEIRAGRGTPDHFNSICIRVHWGERMLLDHFAPENVAEHSNAIRAAIAAISAISDRYDADGTFSVTDFEFQRIGAALCLTDDLQTSTTKVEQEESLRAVLKLSEQQLQRLARL